MGEFKPGNILVTGGAGFIGCNFIRYILDADENVRVFNLDKLTYAGSLNNLKDLPDETRHVFMQGDICDRPHIDQLLRKHEIDTIIHFAAESHVDNSIAGPSVFVQTNVTGTFTLLEAAKNYWLNEMVWDSSKCRFHHISTDEVYGALKSGDAPFTETTPYAPNSPYSASKAASDHLVRAYFHTFGLPVTTSNCSNNYGYYQHSEKFIPTVIRACLNQQAIPVYGDGSNIRDWLYVEDHCRAINMIFRHGSLGEVYNVGGSNEISNIDICRMICAEMDQRTPQKEPHESLISFVQDRPGHDWRYAINADKLTHQMGWEPRRNFNEYIKGVVEFYLK